MRGLICQGFLGLVFKYSLFGAEPTLPLHDCQCTACKHLNVEKKREKEGCRRKGGYGHASDKVTPGYFTKVKTNGCHPKQYGGGRMFVTKKVKIKHILESASTMNVLVREASLTFIWALPK